MRSKANLHSRSRWATYSFDGLQVSPEPVVHRAYVSCKRLFQKRREPAALEVDAAADVREDAAGGGMGGAERGDLSLEVRQLLARRHARVDDLSSVRWRRFVVVADGSVEADGGDVVEPVTSPVVSRQGEGLDPSTRRPLGERLSTDSEFGSGLPRSDLDGW